MLKRHIKKFNQQFFYFPHCQYPNISGKTKKKGICADILGQNQQKTVSHTGLSSCICMFPVFKAVSLQATEW